MLPVLCGLLQRLHQLLPQRQRPLRRLRHALRALQGECSGGRGRWEVGQGQRQGCAGFCTAVAASDLSGA